MLCSGIMLQILFVQRLMVLLSLISDDRMFWSCYEPSTPFSTLQYGIVQWNWRIGFENTVNGNELTIKRFLQ